MIRVHLLAAPALVVILASGAAVSMAARQATPAVSVVTHDNRQAFGSLTEGVLTIRLETRVGEWRPDGPGTPALRVKAFAIEGAAPQVPGPLLRVPAGTEVRAFVSNRTGPEPLALHGMYSRPIASAEPPILIPAGDTREVRFRLTQPGTYFYWAASAADTSLQLRSTSDTQLSGAIVVDPLSTSAPVDRVLVLGYWHNGVATGAGGVGHEKYRYVINGRSWPATERLAYRVGEMVRMRLLNVGADVHPMHLHGFYFNVTSRGDEATDVIAGPTDSPRLVVTERLAQGRTFGLAWTPTRPGNWLFHCHDNVHLDHGGTVDGSGGVPGTAPHTAEHHLSMMAGPVMGITVTGATTEVPGPDQPRRRLELTARVDTGGTVEEPAYGYALGGESPGSSLLPGPTLVLKRGQPVSITVRNELPVPTAVHWHGIELESYYDGVAGYAGEGARVAPAIAPGGAFEARFTPPRSGTFIYHTHMDDTRQQRAGLSGALLVVDDPAQYDAEHDLVFLITTPRRAADAASVLINGRTTPAPRSLRRGERYRLRFINAHTARPSMRMRILAGETLTRWRSIAKDGMDLPADYVQDGPSEVQMGNGETYDFELVPAQAGDLRLDVTNGAGVLLATAPLPVTTTGR